MQYPTVRCWTRHNLKKVIMSVIKENEKELVMSTFYTATEVLHRFQEMGWLHPIKVDAGSSTSSLAELFLVDMEAREGEMIDPLEVLQAYLPQGVLCYFGVLGHLGLTTQSAPFFHIAYLDKSPLPQAYTSTKEEEKRNETLPPRNPLGREAFRFEGVSCYVTKRNIAVIPGIQTRIIAPRIMLRMTTMEQTLLDTLGYPLHCGGESVVFEAWERGTKYWNQKRVADYLVKINRPELDRRVGAMTEQLQVKIDSEQLQNRLDTIKAQVKCAETDNIALLPGFIYPSVNSNWKVCVP